MRHKQLRAVLGALLISSGVSSFAQTDTTSYQLLWEIRYKDLPTKSYLFGSMHSNDPRMFDFPDSLYVGFVNASAVVLETDVSALFETYDVRLDPFRIDFIEKNRGSKMATTTAYGSEDGRPQFLDAYFQQTAHCSGKNFFALETFADQLAASEKMDKLSVRATFNNIFYSDEMFKQTYLQGDIAALTKMLKAQLNGMPGAYETLITKRNQHMATGLDTLMKKQSVFCVIGSGHLYGNDGVLQLLRSKGFTVRRIQNNHTVDLKEKKTMNQWRTYEHKNERYKFAVQLSGKPIESNENGFYKAVYVELGQGNTYEVHVSPGESDLEGCTSEFIHNSTYQPTEVLLADGTRTIEGLVKSPQLGYQWKRIFVKNGFTYELICYGGNKFMHSNRPQLYFSRFQFLPSK